MKRKRKRNRWLLAGLALMVLLGSLLCGNEVTTVGAEMGSAFSIEAEVLPSDKETYDIRVTVENQGGDWEGTARLFVEEGSRKPCAYDTALSLPQGSRKQFVVRVPVDSIDNTNGTVVVTLLDRKDKITMTERFTRLLAGQLEALSLGILSDAYSQLTYLDMGGAEIYFYDGRYPIRLVELQQGSLTDVLDALTFLVIDQYNTSILTEEELEAIEHWNLDGGVLIIGTGIYAADTLGGFADGYLGISCEELVTPKEVSGNVMSKPETSGTETPENEASESEMSGHQLSKPEMSEPEISEPEISEPEMSEPDISDAYTNADTYVDWSQLTMAQLEGVGDEPADYYTGGWVESMGDGSVSVLPYSLTELGSMDSLFFWYSGMDGFVMQILDNAGDYTNVRYSASSSYYDNPRMYIRRMLGVIGNSNSVLNFGILRGIVVVYVIFVGPVLYLILRFLKRQEFYWLAVPAAALLGIGLIFLAGRDFEVVSTRVYSVTVRDLSGSGNGGTYLYCYDAGRREWELRMTEGYEYAGPFSNTSYYNTSNDESYYYHIGREGDIFSVGLRPGSNFDDSYFYLSGVSDGDEVKGGLLVQNVTADSHGISGTIINETDQDMSYFAVLCDDSWYIFEGLPAGAVCQLKNTKVLYIAPVYDYSSSITYDLLPDTFNAGEYKKTSALSALGVGISDVYSRLDQDAIIAIGVVEDWDKTVDDNCSEISYGCLYSVQ